MVQSQSQQSAERILAEAMSSQMEVLLGLESILTEEEAPHRGCVLVSRILSV